jgi:hypothetical protein
VASASTGCELGVGRLAIHSERSSRNLRQVGFRHRNRRRGTTTMTDAQDRPCKLLEKRSDAELLREMISFAAERLMELEV